MDRIRIIGGSKLNGTIPISGAKNAALPLMIAGLLSEETLVLDNVPRLRRRRPAAAHPRQSRRPISPRWASDPATMPIGARPAHFGGQYHRHHGALRAGVADARKLLGDRTAAGADA